jgi:hypothetical protein
VYEQETTMRSNFQSPNEQPPPKKPGGAGHSIPPRTLSIRTVIILGCPFDDRGHPLRNPRPGFCRLPPLGLDSTVEPSSKPERALGLCTLGSPVVSCPSGSLRPRGPTTSTAVFCCIVRQAISTWSTIDGRPCDRRHPGHQGRVFLSGQSRV